MKAKNIMIVRLRIATLMICVVCLPFFGCGEKPPSTAAVTGRVTFQGKPVVAGQIMFLPEHGRPAMGEIGPDGRYTLKTFKTGDGALLGRCRVTIDARRVVGGSSSEFVAGPDGKKGGTTENVAGGIPKIEWLVPEKYSQPATSTLTAEVNEGENTINFDL